MTFAGRRHESCNASWECCTEFFQASLPHRPAVPKLVCRSARSSPFEAPQVNTGSDHLQKKRLPVSRVMLSATPVLSPFPLLHHLPEVVEEIVRVLRAGAGLGMILHAEERHRSMAQALERVVIQVDVGQVYVARLKRIGIDGEVVIVAGDLHFARIHLLHRMIAAVMSELELISLASKSDPDQLVPETDSEDRCSSSQLANILLRVSDWLRIARAVREKDSVGTKRQHIFCRCLRRNHGHAAALFREHAENILLYAEVVCNHMQIRTLVWHNIRVLLQRIGGIVLPLVACLG